MKQPPLDSEFMKSLMASSSSACYYRQTASESVIGYHQRAPEIHGIVIEMVPDNRISVGAGNQQHLGLDFSTVNYLNIREHVKEKSLGKLATLGGVEGIGKSLKTDLQCGIGGELEKISGRKAAFGTNSYVKPPTENFSHFLWEALKDPIIIVLLAFAALSLGLGIKKHGIKDGCMMVEAFFLLFLLLFLLKQLATLTETSNPTSFPRSETISQQKL